MASAANFQTEELKGNSTAYDPVFGVASENGPNYRNVGWLGTVALMMKIQIGLGILSMPATFNTVGVVPGIILLCAVAAIAGWTSHMVGVFKLHHRELYSMDDAGGLMFGRVGREVFGVAFCLYWIFVAGSAMLGISIALNAISSHAICTAGFVAISACIGFIFASIRTLAQISWIAWVGLASILTAVLVVTIAVGIEGGPSSAPNGWSSIQISSNPSFADGVSVVATLIFSCSATPAYFSLASEMRNPYYFTRSVVVSQAASTALYITISVVIYYYCGSLVASPALGSAGTLIKKVAYGISLPGLIATATIDLHLTSKYIFVRILRGSAHLNSNSMVHWATWISCTFGSTVVAYVIASGIPVFSSLVSLVGALLGTFLAYQPAGCMWLYDNWKQHRTWKWYILASWSVFLIIAGTFMTVAGTYGSVVSIINALQAGGGTRPWSCADNSNS